MKTKGLEMYIKEFAKSRDVKLSKSELKEVVLNTIDSLDSTLETKIHNAQTDFVC